MQVHREIYMSVGQQCSYSVAGGGETESTLGDSDYAPHDSKNCDILVAGTAIQCTRRLTELMV